jgi:hypothetical protein
MKTFLQLLVILGILTVATLALPTIIAHLWTDFWGGLAALLGLGLVVLLILGLLLVGGGTTTVVTLALGLAFASVAAALSLPLVVAVCAVLGVIGLARRLRHHPQHAH